MKNRIENIEYDNKITLDEGILHHLDDEVPSSWADDEDLSLFKDVAYWDEPYTDYDNDHQELRF